MRVVAGKHRGRVLAEFQGRDIRPTSDRVKESLFNILMLKIPNARILDVFSGSGNLGIESISRGAKEVVFNDSSKSSIGVLKKNLDMIKENAMVYQMDYASLLSLKMKPFDVIFLDPPYATEFGKNALQLISQNNLLNKEGVIVFETDKETYPEVDGLTLSDNRHYGKTYLYFYTIDNKEIK